jgi:hypothetical protein
MFLLLINLLEWANTEGLEFLSVALSYLLEVLLLKGNPSLEISGKTKRITIACLSPQTFISVHHFVK